MRTLLSEQAVAIMGRRGCGVDDHAREFTAGLNVARGDIVDIVLTANPESSNRATLSSHPGGSIFRSEL